MVFCVGRNPTVTQSCCRSSVFVCASLFAIRPAMPYQNRKISCKKRPVEDADPPPPGRPGLKAGGSAEDVTNPAELFNMTALCAVHDAKSRHKLDEILAYYETEHGQRLLEMRPLGMIATPDDDTPLYGFAERCLSGEHDPPARLIPEQ